MSETVYPANSITSSIAPRALDFSVKSWFAIALIGQWAFALYVFFVYIVAQTSGLDISNISPATGIEKTQGFSRLVFFGHIIPTVYLAIFGLFQLVPNIRNRYKSFHRINGRLFLLLGLSGAVSGLYLQWAKGLTFSQGTTVNGLLIIIAAFFTWYFAVNKRFDLHKRWAIHTFILVNGVWGFRLYLMGWYMVNQGPNGNTPNVDGPMDIALSFACYLVPMAIAEFYFWSKKQTSIITVWSSFVLMSAGALTTLVGVIAAVTMMWTPRIDKVLTAL